MNLYFPFNPLPIRPMTAPSHCPVPRGQPSVATDPSSLPSSFHPYHQCLIRSRIQSSTGPNTLLPHVLLAPTKSAIYPPSPASFAVRSCLISALLSALGLRWAMSFGMGITSLLSDDGICSMRNWRRSGLPNTEVSPDTPFSPVWTFFTGFARVLVRG